MTVGSLKNNAETVLALFGARNIFALRVEFEGRALYVPTNYTGQSEFTTKIVAKTLKKLKTSEYGVEAITAHLNGDIFIGVYPLQEDSTVQWFALDFDGDDDFEEVRKVALAQQEVLLEVGLRTYMEISQSGKGIHLWGFLSEALPASTIRHALSPLIIDTDTYDRMFPNQDGISETRPLGNLIALPLQGDRVKSGFSVFINPVTGELATDQFGFLAQIERIPKGLVEKLFEEAGLYRPERIISSFKGESETRLDSWKMTNPKFGSPFIQHCFENASSIDEPTWYVLACQFAQFQDGRDLFHKWSAEDSRRYDPGSTDRKYNQAIRTKKPHSCEYIRNNVWMECADDKRFESGVYHPFDLADVQFKDLVDSVGTGTQSRTVISAAEGIDRAMGWLAKVESDPTIGQGYKYGLTDIDVHTGIRDTDLIIIAARPSIGKSSIAGHVIDELAVQGVPSYFFSLEMSSGQFWTRQLAKHTGVDSTRMKKGRLTSNDWARIRAWKKEIDEKESYPVFIDEWSKRIDIIYDTAGRLVHTYGKGVIFVDYLQIVHKEGNESEYAAVTRIVTALKDLAKALEVPVVALAQLNRTAIDSDSDGQSLDSWLRGSGQIEQDADVILFLLGERGPGIVERTIVIQKDRHGEAGLRVVVDFNQPLMQWGERGKWIREFGHETKLDNDAPTVTPDDDDLFGVVPVEQVEEDTEIVELRMPKVVTAENKWALSYDELHPPKTQKQIAGDEWKF